MNGLFYGLISKTFSFFGADGLFLTFFIILVALFSFALIIIKKKRINALRKRLWLIFVCFGITVIEVGLEFIFDKISFSIITLGLSFVLCSIALFIPTKEITFTPEQINFAKKISRCVEINDASDHFPKADCAEKPLVETVKAKEISSEKDSAHNKELDFSHVKNVLKRMEYYSISQSDKRQVKDLETALYQAENGGLTDNLKVRINDGLGALLKIMSKYGI